MPKPSPTPPTRGPTVPFVGRARELAVVDAALESAARGSGGLLVVTGEAGIGKTRFCDEVERRAGDTGARVVSAACPSGVGTPALWPWQLILAELGGPAAAGVLAAGDGSAPDRQASVDLDRFEHFTGAADVLLDACADEPLTIVVDDVQEMDAGALLLTRLVVRRLPSSRLLVVLGRRTGETPVGGAEARLLDELERAATPIALAGLDAREAAELLAHCGAALDTGLARTIIAATRGSPLYLRRVAALGPPGPGETLPAGVRAAIERAVAALTIGTRDTLRAAAIVGPAPSIAEVAAVAGVDPTTVLDTVAEAAAAGLVEPVDPSGFTFAHDLVRAVFADGLPAAARLDAHARAAAFADLAGATDESARLARRARHALAAAPRSAEDAQLAVTACRDAARAMADGLDYEKSDALLDAAVAVHTTTGIGAPPAGLLVEWARAALQCGSMTEARQRFDRAAAAARTGRDPLRFAEAALGLGGHWVGEHRAPVERARVLGLQRAALAGLPDGGSDGDGTHIGTGTGDGIAVVDPDDRGQLASHGGGLRSGGRDRVGLSVAALRARLVARLAAEAVFDGGPVEPVLDALADARATGDPLALAEALSLTHHALFTPEHVRTRLPLADELIRAATEAGHGVLALMGLLWRCVDLLHLGDPAAARALEELRERADTLGSQNVAYVVAVIDVMTCIRSGRLDEAEHHAGLAAELGTACGEVDTFGYLSTHLLGIRWAQGRDAELLGAAAEAAASPTLIPAEFALQASEAMIAARAGDRGRARAAVARVAPDGVAALPLSSTWGAGLVALAETAAELTDKALAQDVYDLLAPFADLPVIASVGVLCLGSTERPLGLAAATVGDLDRAVDHLDRAIAANGRLGNRPLSAISRAELAAVLVRRDGPDDVRRARGLLDEAIAEGEQMGLGPRTERWVAERAVLTAGTAALPAGDPAIRPAATLADPARGDGGDDGDDGWDRTSAGRTGTIRQDGRRWEIALDGRRVRVGALVGMRYLAELLTRPGEPVSALALAAGPDHDRGSRQDVIDDEARAAYETQARRLAEEIAQARTAGDHGRADALRVRFDALADHLDGAMGLGGRARAFADDGERARTAVRKAIRRAIDAIDDADPVVATAVRATVTTGSSCVYRPDPARPVTWFHDR